MPFLRAFRLLCRFDGCVGGGLIGGAGFGLQTRKTLLLRFHRVLGRAHGGRLERQGAFFRFAEVFFRRSLHIRCRPLEVGCHFAKADFGQTFQHQGGGRLCSTGKGLDGNTDGGEAVLNGAQQDVDAVQPRFEDVEILPAAAEQGVEGVARFVDVADNGFNQVRHFRRTGFGGIVGGNKGIRQAARQCAVEAVHRGFQLVQTRADIGKHGVVGVGNAARLAEFEHQFVQAVFQAVDRRGGRFRAAEGFFHRRAEFGQEVFGGDTVFDHFFQFGGGDAHRFGGNRHRGGQAFAELAAQFLHADLALTGNLRQRQQHTVGLFGRQVHRCGGRGHALEHLLRCLGGHIDVLGGGGQLCVAVGGGFEFQAQFGSHALHPFQLLGRRIRAAEGVFHAAADGGKLGGGFQNPLQTLLDRVNAAAHARSGQHGAPHTGDG